MGAITAHIAVFRLLSVRAATTNLTVGLKVPMLTCLRLRSLAVTSLPVSESSPLAPGGGGTRSVEDDTAIASNQASAEARNVFTTTVNTTHGSQPNFTTREWWTSFVRFLEKRRSCLDASCARVCQRLHMPQ